MTADFRIMHEVIAALRERDVDFIVLRPSETPPLGTRVIITAPGEDVPGDAFVVGERDAATAVERAWCVSRCGPPPHSAVVGVDPGKQPGVAVVVNGTLLRTRVVDRPEDVINEVRLLRDAVSPIRLVLRIGHGDPTRRDRTIAAVWGSVDSIEVVDETGTTRSPSPDIRAAVSIASRHGNEVFERPEPEPTEGELRDIQRLSRIESRGRVTISMEMAREVALGRVSLAEAVDRMLIS